MLQIEKFYLLLGLIQAIFLLGLGLKFSQKTALKNPWLHKILCENVNYSNFALFIFTCHSLVEWYEPKMWDAYLKFFPLLNEPYNLQLLWFEQPCSLFSIRKSLYCLYAQVDKNATNQKASVCQDNLGCFIVMVAARRASLSSDNSNYIYSLNACFLVSG